MPGKLEILPRGRLALVLLHLAAGAAWLSGDENARLAASMIAAPILVDLAAKLLHRPNLEIGVGPRRAVARSAFLETIRIRNHGRHGRELRLREPRTHVLDAGGAHLPSIAPGEEITLRLTARSPRRGRGTIRSFVVTSAWPLGMFRWRATVDVRAEMVTEPVRTQLPDALLRELAARDDRAAAGTRRDAEEFYALRDYRHGEDARQVHARRSASLGTLVRQVRRGADEFSCALVVDLRRPPGMPPTFGRRELEVQLSRAAALGDALRARGAAWRCAIIDERTRIFEVAARADPRDFLTALAVARTVPFRTLVDGEVSALAAVDSCFWMPAGGYADGMPRGRDNLRLVGGSAT